MTVSRRHLLSTLDAMKTLFYTSVKLSRYHCKEIEQSEGAKTHFDALRLRDTGEFWKLRHEPQHTAHLDALLLRGTG